MAFTLDQYNTLLAAYTQGAKEVQYSNKRVVYRSLAEMKAILEEMEIELDIKPNNNRNRRVGYYCDGF